MLKRDTTGATLEDRFDKTVSDCILILSFTNSFLHLLLPPGSAEGDAGEELRQVFKDEVHPSG